MNRKRLRLMAGFGGYPNRMLSQEEVIVEELGDLLSQDMFNATLGNW